MTVKLLMISGIKTKQNILRNNIQSALQKKTYFYLLETRSLDIFK